MTRTITFAQDIEEAANGEAILAVVISKRQPDIEGPRRIPDSHLGRLLLWSEARPLLDYEYRSGYGSPDCHGIIAWTATRVIFVGVYDGATWIESKPRHPGCVDDAAPKFVGC